MALALQILAAAALALGAFVAGRNWVGLVRFGVGAWRMPVPLVGGVALALGLLGFERTRTWWWVGLVADLGTAWLPVVLAKLARDARASSAGTSGTGAASDGGPGQPPRRPRRERRLP
jgi:hypothetical protein